MNSKREQILISTNQKYECVKSKFKIKLQIAKK